MTRESLEHHLFGSLRTAGPGAAAVGKHRHHVARRARCGKQPNPVLLFLPVADVLTGRCFYLVVAHAFRLD